MVHNIARPMRAWQGYAVFVERMVLPPRREPKTIPQRVIRSKFAPLYTRRAPCPAGKSRWEKSVMMLNWNEYHQQIQQQLGEIMKLSPDTLRGYRGLSEANA